MLKKRVKIPKAFLLLFLFVMPALSAHSNNSVQVNIDSNGKEQFLERVRELISKKIRELPSQQFIDDSAFIDLLKDTLNPEDFEHFLRIGPGDFFNMGIREILSGFVVSELDAIFTKACDIEDIVEIMDSKVDIILPKVCSIESRLDTIVITVDSKVDVIDSDVEVLQETADTILSKVCVVESKVDLISFDSNTIVTIDSKVDVIENNVEIILSKVCTIDSKIDNINIEDVVTVLSKVCVIDSKIDEINIGTDTIITIDSKVDVIDNTVNTILSKVCTLDSKIDVIDNEINDLVNDFRETWTILQVIEDKVSCLVGNTITQADVGTTGIALTSPGEYTVCENIVFSPAMSLAAITISSDNVNLDINGKTISQGNGTAGVSAVEVDASHSGIQIGHGSITGMTSNGVILNSGGSDIQLQEIIVEGCGAFGLTATLVEDLVIKDSAFNQNTDSGVLISSSNRVCLLSTIANDNGDDGFELMGTSNQYLIDNCKAFDNTDVGFNLTNIFDSVLQLSVAIGNGGDGISLSNSSDIEVSNNTSSRNGANGIELAGSVGTLECYISNNKLVRNDGVNLIEDEISGLNSILGNFAQNPSLARNYCEGLSAITTVTIRQSMPFMSSPTPWDNINMIP